jgi:hypothetical protein
VVGCSTPRHTMLGVYVLMQHGTCCSRYLQHNYIQVDSCRITTTSYHIQCHCTKSQHIAPLFMPVRSVTVVCLMV